MKQSGFIKLANIIKQLKDICDQAAQNKETVKTMYTNFDPRKDARITTFSKMVNLFTSVQLSLNFVLKGLSNLDVWRIIIDEEPPPSSDMKIFYAGAFMNFTKIGFNQLLFSTTESSLRLFLRALDLDACDGGMGSFKSVYDCLFRVKLSVCPSEGIELLDLFRLVRNTSHNNGVYFDPNPNRQDITIVWRRKPYKFKQSTPIDFVTWPFVVEISDAVRSLMYTVVTDNNLRAVAHEIKDPYQFAK